jgi:hypothetical protein
MNTSASNNFSPNYDSTPLPAYLHGAQLVPSTWRPPTKAERIEGFRQRMMRDLRQMPPTGLEQFFATVISDDPLVGAYFLPKQVRYAGKEYRQLPYDLSLQAAKDAAGMVLLPPERGAAWMAAFLAPCGLYVCAQQRRERRQGPDIRPGSPTEMTRSLLEDGLGKLRRIHPALSDTLACALGLIDDGDFNAEGASRIATVAYLVNSNIRELWAPKPCHNS